MAGRGALKTERRKKFCSFSLVWLMHSCSRLFTCEGGRGCEGCEGARVCEGCEGCEAVHLEDLEAEDVEQTDPSGARL